VPFSPGRQLQADSPLSVWFCCCTARPCLFSLFFLFSLLHLYYVMSCTYIFFLFLATLLLGCQGELDICNVHLRTDRHCLLSFCFFLLLPIAKTDCQEAPAAAHSIFFLPIARRIRPLFGRRLYTVLLAAPVFGKVEPRGPLERARRRRSRCRRRRYDRLKKNGCFL
jgi:hypothetical protein